jgi:hypothetical protein
LRIGRTSETVSCSGPTSTPDDFIEISGGLHRTFLGR